MGFITKSMLHGHAASMMMLAFLFMSLALAPLLSGAQAQATYDPTEEIAEIQARIDAEGLSWTPGVTSMNQIPLEERQKYLGYRPPPGESGILPPEALIVRPPDRPLPEVWDWRVEGGVTPVKNQYDCGSCWDFAGTGAFESAIKVHTGETYDLSEQQVLVCNTAGQGCSGGWMSTAYDVFIYPGAVEEWCMPYMADDTLPCTQYECEFVQKLDGYAGIGTDITSLKEAIYVQPVAVAMAVLGDFFSYDEGCYENPEWGPINHAVLLVGWDDTACDGEGAWILKNSWGLGWGMGGFCYIKYGCCQVGYGAQEIYYTPRGPVVITHQPLADTDNMTEPYEVLCTIVAEDYPIDESTTFLHYDVGEGWIDELMIRQREDEGIFRAEIPPQVIGTTVRYWLSGADTEGYEDVDPTGAPDNFHEFRITRTFFTDDAESEQGWTYGVPGDDTQTGIWERCEPEGTWGIMHRPGNPDRDHTPHPGYKCFCTGCEAGPFVWSNAVMYGKTTLVSPLIEVREVSEATLTYWRWYTNDAYQNGNEDYWQVDVSNDNGETWVNLEYTNESRSWWDEQTFELQDYIALTDSVLLRFIASDYENPSVVEAGVDDLEIISMEYNPQGVDGTLQVVRRIRLRPSPNPVTGDATIRFELAQPARGALRVYGVDGRTVRTLQDGFLGTGSHGVIWDGRDDGGREVPAGLYLIRLSTATGMAESRLLRLR